MVPPKEFTLGRVKDHAHGVTLHDRIIMCSLLNNDLIDLSCMRDKCFVDNCKEFVTLSAFKSLAYQQCKAEVVGARQICILIF